MLIRIILATLTFAMSYAANANEIVIGQSAPLSGSNAETGTDIQAGALAYFRKVNNSGGIRGARIRLVTLDDMNDPETARKNTVRLIQTEKAVALFGYASSTLSLPSMPTVESNKVPFFAPFTGAEIIRKQNDYVFTIRATYADEIEKIVAFWGSLGSTRITVLHYRDEVGAQNFATVARALEKFGKQPVSIAIARNKNIADESVKAVIASNPQIIVITTLYTPAAQLIKKLKAAGRDYLVTSLSFAGTSQLVKALGPDAGGISVTLTVPPPNLETIPIVRECNEAWLASGQPAGMSVTALEACIAAKVLVDGLKKAGPNISRQSLYAALDRLNQVDVGGFQIGFKPGFHHGGSYVEIGVVRKNGTIRS